MGFKKRCSPKMITETHFVRVGSPQMITVDYEGFEKSL